MTLKIAINNDGENKEEKKRSCFLRKLISSVVGFIVWIAKI